MMKFEKINKDNISKVLNSLILLSSEQQSIRCSSDYTEEEKEKFKTEANELMQKYFDHIFDISGLEAPTKRMIEFCSGSTYNYEDSNVPEHCIMFQENGRYHYSYYRDTITDKIYATLAELEADMNCDYIIKEAIHSQIAVHHYNEDLDVLFSASYSFDDKFKAFKLNSTISICSRDKLITSINKGYNNTYYVLRQDGLPYEVCSNFNLNGGVLNETLLTEASKMFQPIVNIGANNFVVLDTADAFEKFMAYNAKLEVKDGPKQRKINELVALPLKESEYEFVQLKGSLSEDSFVPVSVTSVQKVKENTCVIKWELFGKYSDVRSDGFRIYIEGKDIYPCKLNNNNQFVRTTISNIKPENFLSSEMLEVNPDDLKGTILQYYGSIINDIPKEYRSLLMLLFIKEPKLEQLFKMGLTQLIYAALHSNNYEIITYIDRVLNTDATSKNKDVFKYLGLNKFQFKTYNKYLESKGYTTEADIATIKHCKTIFCTNDLSSIDNKTFEAVFNAVCNAKPGGGWYNSIGTACANLGFVYSSLNTVNPALTKVFVKLVPDLLALTGEDVRLYKDYINMVLSMDAFKSFKITATNPEDIRDCHNAAMAIYNLKRETYRAKEFVRQLEKVEKLVYENKDDDFCVVIPTKPEDLAREGLELHHCVKSYIDKVSRGDTNIVFIRQKSDKDKPFFTVEVSNDKVIEQVHGFANRNANTEPKLTEFINRWAKAKRLKAGNFNKVR